MWACVCYCSFDMNKNVFKVAYKDTEGKQILPSSCLSGETAQVWGAANERHHSRRWRLFIKTHGAIFYQSTRCNQMLTWWVPRCCGNQRESQEEHTALSPERTSAYWYFANACETPVQTRHVWNLGEVRLLVKTSGSSSETVNASSVETGLALLREH